MLDNWADELVPDIWVNELVSLMKEQYPRETSKIWINWMNMEV
jgi:hypothetical protein